MHSMVSRGPLLGNADTKDYWADSSDGMDSATMVLSPSTMFYAVALIALAVWFR